MTPYWSDDHLTLFGGDCREVMAEMEPASVHCVVTSPPYWGLRDYGTATWDGGEPGCSHRLGSMASDKSTLHSGHGNYDGEKRTTEGMPFRDTCGVCGAVRQDRQLGLEPTPEEYVANMVAVFREVRRVLRDDGTLWLNLGDSYAGSWGAQSRGNHTGDDKMTLNGHEDGLHISGRQIAEHPQFGRFTGTRALSEGRKPKDLTGIPWMVAFALRADGWYLRSDIIWSKPNPMPESVTDRPTKAHEYLFLLSKSPRYYFDADAVRETAAYPDGPNSPQSIASPYGQGFTRKAATWEERKAAGATAGSMVNGHNASHGEGLTHNLGSQPGRNIRSVWTIATEPYPGAHFATFPRKLVEPCVKAGCPEGGTVLDPFAGSGTTLLVAQALGRRGVGIDLNPDYLRQALTRNAQTPLGLVS